MKPKTQKLIVAAVALVLIGVGAACIYPAAGPIAVGALLWLDLSIGSARK